jgi:hypothetical protein
VVLRPPILAHLLSPKQRKKKSCFSLIKLRKQSKSKEYKRFSSGVSNLSPLHKLLVQFNITQT